MRIYKPNYTDRDGEKRKTAKWYLDFSDHNQLRHKIPAFADKRLSEAFGRNIESLVNCRLSGLEPDSRLNQWIETLPENLLKKFVFWGLIDGQRSEITKPLQEHISDYIKILEAKGIAKDSVVRTRNRLEKIVSDCREEFPEAVKWQTKTRNGCVDIYDNGKILSPQERMQYIRKEIIHR